MSSAAPLLIQRAHRIAPDVGAPPPSRAAPSRQPGSAALALALSARPGSTPRQVPDAPLASVPEGASPPELRRLVALLGPGRPLPASALPVGFGAGSIADEVRVHDDPRSHEAAALVGSEAFTLGRDVVLGHSAASSHSRSWLLAHEVAHAAQQSGVSAPAAWDPEREADRFADHATGSGAAPELGATPTGLARKTVTRPRSLPPSPPGPLLPASKALVDSVLDIITGMRASGLPYTEETQKAVAELWWAIMRSLLYMESLQLGIVGEFRLREITATHIEMLRKEIARPPHEYQVGNVYGIWRKWLREFKAERTRWAIRKQIEEQKQQPRDYPTPPRRPDLPPELENGDETDFSVYA